VSHAIVEIVSSKRGAGFVKDVGAEDFDSVDAAVCGGQHLLLNPAFFSTEKSIRGGFAVSKHPNPSPKTTCRWFEKDRFSMYGASAWNSGVRSRCTYSALGKKLGLSQFTVAGLEAE
jgi:hypothetical protein